MLKEKLEKYLDLTKKAKEKVKIKIPEIDLAGVAKDYLDLSESYYKDALFFKEKGDLINAFAAVCYAHAFLDAGARLGVFDVHDSTLFMVDD